MTVPESKYEALTHFLEQAEDGSMVVPLAVIDRIVGGLPHSARSHRAWWSNTGQPHSVAWVSVGRRVLRVDPNAGTVHFSARRNRPPSQMTNANDGSSSNEVTAMRDVPPRGSLGVEGANEARAPGSTSGPGTYRESDGSAFPMAEAKRIWAPLAREILEQVAGTYHAITTYGELAEELQARSGIRTRQRLDYWIGGVLGDVARGCRARGEPLLSALCVSGSDGTVGPGYASVIELREAEAGAPDIEMHAAAERLRCYEHFGADLPEGGGLPKLSPQVAKRREYEAQQARKQMRRAVCPGCHVQLPLTGQCDNCG